MKMLSLAAAACIAASFALAAGPAAAHYHSDPGPAIAGGLLGLGLGAAIGAAQQQQQATPPVCESPDGARYYARPIDGEWQCEEDD